MKATIFQFSPDMPDAVKDFLLAEPVSISPLGVALGGAIESKKPDSGSWYHYNDDATDLIVRMKGKDFNSTSVKGLLKFYMCRPALQPSATADIQSAAKPTGKIKELQIVEYGEFPQSFADNNDVAELNNALKYGLLRSTGKKYTFDMDKGGDKPQYQHYDEYFFRNKRYVCIPCKPINESIKYNDDIIIRQGDFAWVRVEPIEWIVCPNGWWIAKNGLFTGLNSLDSIVSYLDTYFSAQMMCNEGTVRTATNETTSVRRPRPNSITITEASMSITEQIKFYVDTGKSFMLHGPSGVGKTARVEAVDPDLTAIPLWNGVLPEDIVGKVCYPGGVIKPLLMPNKNGDAATERLEQGGTWVAPDWYNELSRKCAANPDRNHILFIDEITNARPTTQSLIFHIVLKKSISPSKGKLPSNTVVVLAGNERGESGAAYNMPAPLFRRMSGHIYLKPDLMEWIKWASQKSVARPVHPGQSPRQNAHPLIVQFLACYSELFYSEYNEDNPQQYATDPRGWVQVSDMIYDNNNVLQRELLENKIGAVNANALMAFARNPILSLEDVLSGNYDATDVPTGLERRYAQVLVLQHVDERHVGIVRDFIQKYLGAEYLASFDCAWTKNSAERAIQIARAGGNLNHR